MNDFDSIIKSMTTTQSQPGDYTGEDGLLYCGKCRTAKQFRMDEPSLEGRLFPCPCRCKQEQLDREAAEQEAHRHHQTVAELKRRGFTDPTMQEWTFANDNGKCQQMKHAHFFVEHWEIMRREDIGYLLWGGVGTGKSYFAGCVANALMEQEIPVRMTFALILNDLTASFEERNEYIANLCRAPLLILDDFGMERGTEYGLEQVYNVIDSRYRSRKPLIVTINISLQDLQHPQDTAHARIYDRLLEMCAPIRFAGESNGTGQAGTFEKYDEVKGAVYGKQNSQPHRGYDISPSQARHPALVGEENRQDHLFHLGAFQRNQHGNDGGQNQAYAP